MDKKIFKYLMLAVLGASAFLVVKEVVLKPEVLTLPEISQKLPAININFDVLEEEDFQNLIPFEKISEPEEVSRENPFIPY